MRFTMSNFVKIGQMVVEILRFFGFPKWRRPPSWIFKKIQILSRRNVRETKLTLLR